MTSFSRYRVEITSESINLTDIMKAMDEPSHGAQVLFLGVVRNRNLGKAVLAVEYDVHPALATVAMNQVCEEVLSQWSDVKIELIHRVGRLAVGEASVVIAVSSPHRSEAYLASRTLIDRIKHRVPIWKKEYYETGESDWLEGHALCDSTAE